MSERLSARNAALLCCLMIVFAVGTAKACPPFGQPDARYVGDTSTDANCTDNDIQTAINNVSCPNTTIYITNEHTYTAQHLTIGRSMSLVGVASGIKCNPPPPICADPPCTGPPAPTAPLVTVDGTGHTGDSVVSISGNASVTLQYLDITGGQEDDAGHGGGVYFDGYGTLNLNIDTINANKAGYGAGVYIKGDGGQANLRVNDNVQIIGNTAAHDGGGIMAEGNARLYALGNPVLISLNHAPNGKGGGIHVVGPARADLGAVGYGGLGILYDNDAAYGGGMSVVATSDNNAVARLFTTDPSNSVAVQSNHASVEGGAFYLLPVAGTSSASAYACIDDARIDANVASEGAVGYLDHANSSITATQGGYLYFNAGALASDDQFQTIDGVSVPPCGPETAASLGAVACTAGASCNEVSDNLAINSSNQPSGSAFYSSDNSILVINGVSLRGNQGIYGFNANDSYNLVLQTTLIADNEVSEQLVIASGGPTVDVADTTIAHDLIDATHAIKIGSSVKLTMRDDIVDEAGTLTLDQPGSLSGNSNLDISDTLTNDTTTLPSAASVIEGDPLFVSVAQGNYHLQAFVQNGVVKASPAIDFAAPVTGDDRDLDGRPYDQDVPSVADRFGTRDLGAYEMQPITDRIFADGFGDPTSLVY